nr:UvrD-like helicase, ATP-binding domain, P-loop containing nucleoside triphosphate hydrolase [Tanacetum cinerariifolium]
MMEKGSLRKQKKKGITQREENVFGKLIFSWSLDDILDDDFFKDKAMMEKGSLRKQKKKGITQGEENVFGKLIFSWSLDDILDDDFFKDKVKSIPLTFESKEDYLGSFVDPLLEETRAELASSMEVMYRAPYAELCFLNEAKGDVKCLYDIAVGPWKNRFNERGKEPYKTLPGDLLILADGKPESVADLQRVGRIWSFALVDKVSDDDNEDDINNSTSTSFKVKTFQEMEFQEGMFVIFLMNVTTQKRIWNSLHMKGNLDIVEEVIYSDSVVKEDCDICNVVSDDIFAQNFDPQLLVKLNKSQRDAIVTALCKTRCCHNSSVQQIWGPPGTGKTTTVSLLLFILLQMNRKTLTCAPTNVAVVQVASRVLRLVKESFKTTTASGDTFYSMGDVLLYGNKERLKVGSDIEEIYLENRVKRLTECLGSLTGWRHCIRSMVNLLEECVSQYHVFVENESLKQKQLEDENEAKTEKLKVQSFIEFMRERFSSCALPLRRCMRTFVIHIPRSFLMDYNFQNMITLLDNLTSFESLLFQDNMVSEELEGLFSSKPLQGGFVESGDTSSINFVRASSLSVLKSLEISLHRLGLPSVLNRYAIKDFCFQRASLIFCTTSTSYKLHTVDMEPSDILVIDEAAQLKEAESTIPLQLPGMKHAILIGDGCQLPAMVTSNVCIESDFGRSLFDRLSSLGRLKNLLNVQYRMHPSISFFPNWKFYQNQILDAENVISKSYEKQYLPGPMFGSYSFINVNLYREWLESKKKNKKLTVGVVSPYTAQVVSIQEKLASKYEKLDGFSVKVKSIDGFQGGEEDIIILSTVRSNSHGSVGFISSPQRTNVALTRAKHCLWILGNERTLTNSESVWSELVYDARNRSCLFDAADDECLRSAIIATKKELEELDDLVNGNSILFTHAKWKVLFSDDFKRSFGKLTSSSLKKVVMNLLLKLSGGWRPKNRSVDLHCEKSSQIIKQFKVEGYYVICTIDVIKEVKYIQVLKVWDILTLEEIPKLTKRLESIFAAYTDDYINRCTAKCLDGNLEVPKCWPPSQEIIRFRYLDKDEGDSGMSVNPDDVRIYVENSKVSESLLLMKFYSLSRGVVSHLLSGKELDLPMQVTDEQMEIILFSSSSFIIGRSGTGKTTILTMKLVQNEQSFHNASEGIYEPESSQVRDVEADDVPENRKQSVLRQLFVTVSPRLCHAVKQHVSHLTSISCNGSSSIDINLDDVDVTSEFSDVPDTFSEVPIKNYPLVITFHRFLMMLDSTLGDSFFGRFREACSFLMMLDSTLGDSFFGRFREAREGSNGNAISSRSVALKTFIRLREVTFDRFCSIYWPHFNSNLTKKLDPSRVFTEIISHIKGGIQAGECSDGKLSFEGYCLLAESRSSTLTKLKRENVYTLFQAYEKMKSERGEFDLGDFVNDIHRRLKIGDYEGDQMDFVYIDEVQDLSMRQISLFKYICQNVVEGFIFAGDTAQTIARGIDFRFQDIRSLFYKEFLSTRTSGKQEKGLVSEIFQLKQNFRTHAGVLDLAQSVIDILYCYFVHSMDILEPETSLISGEAPVLLESGNDENAIVTIFGDTGTSGEIVGFGAEQVILVRDDCAKAEICEYIGKNALVLTIVECKGLEFQDVLLYNFFGTSPLKDQWRVIYGYMKDHDWLDEKHPQSFPPFKEAKHSVLCSELKQLYVAITRTRQRLWICENIEELSKPIFDYWKKRGLVQVRKLDDSVAQAMRVASSPQEWRDRGKKNNFVMATMCFERAGDTMWEKLAKASGLRASAEQMRGTNQEAFQSYVREAAGMFESIGKLESAASCYCDLAEYERAGKIYLYKCGKMDAAAECFTLAGCYSDAAEAYAKGDKFSNCLSVCKTGKLFDEGLRYIESWKEDDNHQTKEIEQIEQEFLESCALDYYGHKDLKSMMKFVRAFCSMESKRIFLRSLCCLDELLVLEEESGHFLEAAELARSWGDVLKEADFLEKAGDLKEATVLLLWYVFFRSLWGNENRGWPLKEFDQKEEICNKVKSLAKTHSESYHDAVCSELKVISDQHSTLPELKKDLRSCQSSDNLRGGILLIRKLLDAHFQQHFSKYVWEDELPTDINEHCYKIFENKVSVRTLSFYWNLWKENVVDILESLGSFDNEEPNKYEGHIDFNLMYFGVRKHRVKGNMVYLVVDKDAEWIRKWAQKGLLKDKKRVTIDDRELVFAIRSYWQSELFSVGIKVLEVLEGLRKAKSNGSVFHQSTSLLHVFEVSKSLLDCHYLNLTNTDTKKLRRFIEIYSTYFDLVFPLDWRNLLSEDLISLGKTDLSVNLLHEIILQHVDVKGDLSYSTIGRVMMICLGSRISVAHYEHVINKLQKNPSWKLFAEKFRDRGLKDVDAALALHNALADTFRANWRVAGYISPHSFVYMLDRLLLMQSFFSRHLYTMKSSFVGSFTHIHSTATPIRSKGPFFIDVCFVLEIVQQILYNKEDTILWIKKSKIDLSYYPLLVLKLVMLLSLLCLEVSDCSNLLFELLSGYNNISYLLPKKFVCDLKRRRRSRYLNLNPEVVADAFKSVNDPLLILCSEDAGPKIYAPSAIFVDLRNSKEEIMSKLFPRKNQHNGQTASNNVGVEAIHKPPPSTSSLDANLNVHPVDVCKVEPRIIWNHLENTSDYSHLNGESSYSAELMKELDKNICTLAAVLEDGKSWAEDDATLLHRASNEMKVLLSGFDSSRHILDPSALMNSMEVALVWLQRYRPKIDIMLKRYAMSQVSKAVQLVVSESSSTTQVEETGDEKNHDEETGDASLVEPVLEKQTSGGNTQEAENQNNKGNNNKGNNSKGNNNNKGNNSKGNNNNKGNGKGKKGKKGKVLIDFGFLNIFMLELATLESVGYDGHAGRFALLKMVTSLLEKIEWLNVYVAFDWTSLKDGYIHVTSVRSFVFRGWTGSIKGSASQSEKKPARDVNDMYMVEWPPRITLGRLLPHARGIGFKPRRGGFPSGAKKEWGLFPKAKVRVLHTAQLDVTVSSNH